MLVEAKASLTRKDYQGSTPRMQALKADDRELAAYLESKYFDIPFGGNWDLKHVFFQKMKKKKKR